MKISIDRQWRISAESYLELPLAAISVWGQMRDVARFLSMDPLHTNVQLVKPGGNHPARTGSLKGCEIVLPHRLLGIGPTRRGRILTWREGRGFAISDLSRRSPHVSFPHICTYEVVSTGPERCRLTIGARGKWTATWMPRWLVWAWLWWVLRATEGRVAMEMAKFAIWRRTYLATPAKQESKVPV